MFHARLKTFSICFGNGNQYGNRQTEKDRKKYYVSVTLLKLAGINKSLYRG